MVQDRTTSFFNGALLFDCALRVFGFALEGKTLKRRALNVWNWDRAKVFFGSLSFFDGSSPSPTGIRFQGPAVVLDRLPGAALTSACRHTRPPKAPAACPRTPLLRRGHRFMKATQFSPRRHTVACRWNSRPFSTNGAVRVYPGEDAAAAECTGCAARGVVLCAEARRRRGNMR